MAMYSCDSGYTLVVGAALSCGASGAWSGPAPTCGRELVVEAFYREIRLFMNHQKMLIFL
ncbi:hypothetical protein DPMN_114350 [Dreissena polymorpha]|uniref:Sushi domain-containing protein n=1 Tax=Dreissena polymorpha TaxID=45954 RepID=A0A9D4KJ84_DREPO|nr:hypothetical protein DPMN_114350 [Dreissena polymorpha]